jgi:type I restriction enzyme M protein
MEIGFLLTGEIRNQIDRIWDSFWSGGISNPIEVIKLITYLLFLRRLDELHTVEERKVTMLKSRWRGGFSPKAKTRGAKFTKTCAGLGLSTSSPARCTPWSAITSFRFCAPWAATAPPMPTT